MLAQQCIVWQLVTLKSVLSYPLGLVKILQSCKVDQFFMHQLLNDVQFLAISLCGVVFFHCFRGICYLKSSQNVRTIHAR